MNMPEALEDRAVAGEGMLTRDCLEVEPAGSEDDDTYSGTLCLSSLTELSLFERAWRSSRHLRSISKEGDR